MVPNLPAIYGKPAIGEYKRKKSQALGEVEMSIKIEDTQIAGDFGLAVSMHIICGCLGAHYFDINNYALFRSIY